MLEFIVLGEVPGTNIQINYMTVIAVVAIVLGIGASIAAFRGIQRFVRARLERDNRHNELLSA